MAVFNRRFSLAGPVTQSADAHEQTNTKPSSDVYRACSAAGKVFLMYLLQPMVNYLCKPPRRWCDKCVKRRGEICCEGCFRVTKVKNHAAPPPSPAEPRSTAVFLTGVVYSTLLIGHRASSLDTDKSEARNPLHA